MINTALFIIYYKSLALFHFKVSQTSRQPKVNHHHQMYKSKVEGRGRPKASMIQHSLGYQTHVTPEIFNASGRNVIWKIYRALVYILQFERTHLFQTNTSSRAWLKTNFRVAFPSVWKRVWYARQEPTSHIHKEGWAPNSFWNRSKRNPDMTYWALVLS